jgi:hypothetical protein
MLERSLTAMPGTLTAYLKDAMRRAAPEGWRGTSVETTLLSPSVSKGLGYAPAADLLLESTDGVRRIWVKFEVVRTDPVANHAKFAIASLIEPFADTFVAMVSPHMASGSRTLAAHAVVLMRRLGMRAFQTTLFPQLDRSEIARLDQLPRGELVVASPPLEPEWDRLLAIIEPLVQRDDGRILFVGDPAEVGWNIHRWNAEMGTSEGRSLWAGATGFRTIETFVWWPSFRSFAPAKFAAFVPESGQLGMSFALYAQLDQQEPRFTGRRASAHLEKLGFEMTEDPEILTRFWTWKNTWGDTLHVRGNAPVILTPPSWVR